MRTLVERQLEGKYADRLAKGALEQSWSAVAELCRLVATQRPGRREASNARAVDVLEANDVWLLDVPFVVAAGLVAGEWPREVGSTLPPELHEAVLSGDGAAASLAPRTAWMDGRDRDQFGDVLDAAGDALVVTRHTERADGTEKRPSPLLECLDVESVPEDARRRLVSPDRELPAPIRSVLRDRAGGAGE
jgi:ATP-dependent helicase/nuclease subunit B